jgi:hypothetical protein
VPAERRAYRVDQVPVHVGSLRAGNPARRRAIRAGPDVGQ